MTKTLTLILTIAFAFGAFASQALADPSDFGILTVSAEEKAASAADVAEAVEATEDKGVAPAATPVSAVAAASAIVLDSAVDARDKTPDRIFRFGVSLDDDSGSVFSTAD